MQFLETKEQAILWDDKIRNFIKLFKTKNLLSIANQPIHNFKSDHINEIIDNQGTFRPSINKVSKMIVEKKIEEAGGNLEDYYNKETIRQKKLQNMIDEKKRQQEENLTFTPKINKIHRSSTSYYPTSQEYEQIKDDLQFKLDARKRVKEEVEKQRDNKELSECTFKPQINSNKVGNTEDFEKPSNFEKEIGRMRYAYYQRIKQKQKAEKIPIGEKYEYLRSLPINPPKCAMNYIIRTDEPFLYLDINIGGGKTGRIGLKSDDDPYLKAKEFAIAFQINEEMETGLASLLCEQLELYLNEQCAVEAFDDSNNDYNKQSIK